LCTLMLVFSPILSAEISTVNATKDSQIKLQLTAKEQAWLTAHPNITFGGGGIPGSDYTDAVSGEIIGVGPDYLRAISELLGVQFNHVSNTWAKAHELAEQKQIDGIRLLLRNKAREKYLNFSEPYVAMQHSVFQRKGSEKFRSLDELESENIKIGVLHRSYAETHLRNTYPNLQIVTYPIVTAALKALVNHSVDAVIATDTSAAQVINDLMLASVEPVMNIPGMEQMLHVGVRKDWPEFIPILNKAIKAISREKHTEIRSKWIATSRANKFDLALTDAEKDWLAQSHTVQVGVIHLPPYQIIGKQGPAGISVDYLKLIAKRTGVKLEFVVQNDTCQQSFQRLSNLQGPELIQCVQRTPEKEHSASFSKDYISSPRVIYVSNNSQYIHGIEDLSGKTIAVPDKTEVHKLLVQQYPDINLKLSETDLQALQAVAFGHADAYIGNLVLSTFLISEQGLVNLKVASPSPFGDNAFAFANRLEWPELSSIINKGLDTITSSEKTEIRNKYTPIVYEHTEAVVIVKWLLIIGGVASAIVLLLMFWNKSLKQKVRQRTVELKSINQSLQLEIAERKQAEALLNESKKNLLDAQSMAHIGNWSWEIKSNKITWSDEVYRIYGVELGEHISYEKLMGIIHPEDRDYHNAQTAAWLENNGGEPFEYRIVLPDNTIRYILGVGEVAYDESGEQVKMHGTLQDITERKLAEIALSKNEVKYRSLVDNSLVGVFNTNLDGEFIYVNTAMAQMYEFDSIDQMLSEKTINRWVDLQQREQLLATLQAQGSVSNFEAQTITRTGKHIFVMFSVKLTDDIISGMVMNITEKKQAEDKLSLSEEKFYRVFQASPAAIVISDISSGEFVDANKAFENNFGYNRDDVVGKGFMEIDIWKNPEDRERLFPQYLKQRTLYLPELEVLKKSGETAIVEIHFTLIRIKDHDLSYASFIDITERKRVESKLNQYQQRLKSLAVQLTLAEEQERRRIAEDLHDHVGQSLALTRLQLAAARKDLPTNKTQDAQLEDVSQSLLKAIQDTRHLIFELSSPSLNELGLSAAIGEWMEEQLLNKYGIQVKLIDLTRDLSLPPDLRALLFRNTRELLSNIIKHAQATSVSVFMEQVGAELVITIQDDGVGFDTARLVQGNQADKGFGLFSVQERMTDLGGKLEIISQPGIGSKLVLYLPVVPV